MSRTKIDDPTKSPQVSQFLKGFYSQLSLRIFGDIVIFQGPGYGASIYVDMEEVIALPLIILDHTKRENWCLNSVHPNMSRQLHHCHSRSTFMNSLSSFISFCCR
jgi:hypothetical protein